MIGIFSFLRGVFVLTACYLGCVFFALLAFLSLPFSPSGRIWLKIARVWADYVLFFSGGRVQVCEHGGVDWDKPMIVMSNHVSTLDIPILFKSIPTDIRFMAKHVLARVPIFGWSAWAAGFIFVNRSSPEKSYRSIDAAAKVVKKGRNVVVFPEGTRSENALLLPFKKGAFVLAAKTGVQVVPVFIHNSQTLMSKGAVVPQPADVAVHIGSSIDASMYTMDTKDELLEQVRHEISRLGEVARGSGQSAQANG